MDGVKRILESNEHNKLENVSLHSNIVSTKNSRNDLMHGPKI